MIRTVILVDKIESERKALNKETFLMGKNIIYGGTTADMHLYKSNNSPE
jgi:hypothetical protein